MESSSDNNKKNTRTTLSLKSNVGVSSSKAYSSGSKTVEIEIKRKKHGLAIDVEEAKAAALEKAQSTQNSPTSAGNLTDQEFKARVKALQEAMKEEATDSDDTKTPEELMVKPSSYAVSEESSKFSQNETENMEEQKVSKDEVSVDSVSKSRFQISKKKVGIGENITPVVFKSSDYVKPVKTDIKKKEQPVEPKVGADNNKTDVPDVAAAQVLASKPHLKTKTKEVEDDTDASGKKKGKLVVKAKQSVTKKAPGNGKITRTVLDRVFNNDLEERTRSVASFKRARMKLKGSNKDNDVAKVVREVNIPDAITVGELANRMAVRAADVIKYLMKIGTLATVNQSIDGDTAEVICSEFGHTPKRVSASHVENELLNIVDDPADLSLRAPIVAIMGHVDHGKTTLLDTLRRTAVAQKEAGGITQHVAAYQVETKSGKKITFIDTPGHAAFTNIRSRGAVITDIIVLVVAADDGIKESTIESIHHAKSQNVPIIVAINKIDKPNINIDKVKTELMNHEIVLEDFGGDVLSSEISALKNINLDGLLETILLQAEVLELKANKNRKAVGTILESRVDKGRGIISSVIIQHGTIKTGDIFVAGAAFGKVRTIYDDKGKKLDAAGPSTPVDIVGFNSSPEPGDVLSVVDNEQKAREIAEYRLNAQKAAGHKAAVAKTMDQLIAGHKADAMSLNIIVKADVYGSLEAIVASIEAIHHPEIEINIVDKSVGIISESDVDFAKNTGAIIIGFNVNTSAAAKESSKLNGVKILLHNVIYHITEEVKKIMSSMLAPIVEENYIGTAEVRKIFVISRYGTIAGCYVTDGIVKRSDTKIKVKRDGKYVFEGKMRSMKHEKDEIKEARQSHECGILAEGFNDFKESDLIECYEIVLKSRSVD